MIIKKPEPALQVHYQELQRNCALRCFFEASHDSCQTISALVYTKDAFNSVAFLGSLIIKERCGFTDRETVDYNPSRVQSNRKVSAMTTDF